ncbi:MAG: LacI family transcriptional regulator [Clostridiales bacterium]|mgnify:CR=1 FL=1|nr:LacI family transcriptional regulator [Clostridiales bacterium]
MYDINKRSTSKNITIGDIAKELNLSKTTISRAISGKGRVSAETRRKVHEYIKLHNYRPNVIARGLAQSKTYNIGVILPADANLVEIPFFQSCLMGVCESAAGLDYDVVVTTVTDDDITLLKRLINNQKVDGVVLTRSMVNDLSAKYLKEVGIPFVLIGSSEDEEIIQIDSDHTTGCCELTNILLKSGTERIALLVGNQNIVVNRSRYEGFRKAFQDLGQYTDSDLVFLDLNNIVLIQQAVNAILDKNVECIICADDFICSRVLAHLEEKQIKVPDMMKVASFYNSSLLETHNPPITAIKINGKELGITAGKKLIGIISGEESSHKSLVNYEIVLKKSTS